MTISTALGSSASTVRAILTTSISVVAIVACSSSTKVDDPPAGGTASSEHPTFASAVEAIVQEKCQSCHREGGIAPFPLVTYEDLKNAGEAARMKIVAREMPPWGAFDDDACKVQHRFKDDLRLSDAQLKTFERWFADGMPAGDLTKRPAPKTFSARGLENRTHSFAMKQPYEVTAGGKDDIRCFPMDPGLTQDTWVSGANVVPGDPRVVHHVIVYVDPKGEGAKKAGDAGNYPCFGGPQTSNPSLLLAWAPGVPPAFYGEDAGVKIPKGAHLVMQVHYHPHPSVTAKDTTAFELRALPTKPSFVATVLLLGNTEATTGIFRLLPGPNDPPSGPAFVIPPNATGHTETMVLDVPKEFQGGAIPTQNVVAAGAHMHWAGVDMKIEVTRKSPSEGQPERECLVGTPKYDFNWQRGYSYDEPTDKLPQISPGDQLKFTCTYDNSTKNKYVVRAMSESHLSSPPEIHLGETTLDEMCLGVLFTTRPATVLD